MLSRYLTADSEPGRLEKDPNQPLNLYAGTDSFSAIGEPEGAGMRRNVPFERLWQELIEASMPKAASAATAKDPAAVLGDLRRWAEDKVDAMRQQKDEELEQYKKEIERAKRFEAQKASGVSAAAGGGEKLVVKRKAVVATAASGGAPQQAPAPVGGAPRRVNRVMQQ